MIDNKSIGADLCCTPIGIRKQNHVKNSLKRRLDQIPNSHFLSPSVVLNVNLLQIMLSYLFLEKSSSHYCRPMTVQTNCCQTNYLFSKFRFNNKKCYNQFSLLFEKNEIFKQQQKFQKILQIPNQNFYAKATMVLR